MCADPARHGGADLTIFIDQGFSIWGGRWHEPIDYQHFQVSRTLAERLARSSSTGARDIRTPCAKVSRLPTHCRQIQDGA